MTFPGKFLVVGAMVLASGGLWGAPAGIGRSIAAGDNPLGIAMETVTYPFPVRFVTLDHQGSWLRMAYMDVAANGPSTRDEAVLLLHGKNFYGSYWEGTIRRLAGAGYRVVIPDQIGFGKSAKPEVDYSFERLAANTARLLDELGVERVAVIGHSMGGMLAVRFALMYPQRTSRLILENPIGLEDYREKIGPKSTDELVETEMGQTAEGYRAFVSAYFARPQASLVEPFVDVRERVSRSGEFPRWAKAAALTYQMIYREPVRQDFVRIDRPTLLVIGQADRTAVGKAYAAPEVQKTLGNYPELGRAAARDIPEAKLVELAGVGHIPHLEAPDVFNTAVLEFLGR